MVLDIVVLAFVIFFFFIDTARGFIRSSRLLLGLFSGLWVGVNYADLGTKYLVDEFSFFYGYTSLVYIGIFFLILLFAIAFFYLLSLPLKRIFEIPGLRLIDKLLAMLLGVGKGFLLATIAIMVLTMFYNPSSKWTEGSRTYPYVLKLNKWIIREVEKGLDKTDKALSLEEKEEKNGRYSQIRKDCSYPKG